MQVVFLNAIEIIFSELSCVIKPLCSENISCE